MKGIIGLFALALLSGVVSCVLILISIQEKRARRGLWWALGFTVFFLVAGALFAR